LDRRQAVALFWMMRTDVKIKNRRSDEWYIFEARRGLDKQRVDRRLRCRGRCYLCWIDQKWVKLN